MFDYSINNVPDEVLEAFFRFKEETFGTDYGLTNIDYLNKYHVTNIYALSFENEPHAIIMSCEQLPIVFLENTTYDQKFAAFSLGQILYDTYLESLISKSKKELYLGGGDREYKKHYGSEEKTTYRGVIYRNTLKRSASQMYGLFKRTLKNMI